MCYPPKIVTVEAGPAVSIGSATIDPSSLQL
jgi:hypothetical protein